VSACCTMLLPLIRQYPLSSGSPVSPPQARSPRRLACDVASVAVSIVSSNPTATCVASNDGAHPNRLVLTGGSTSMGSFGSLLVWSFMGIKGSRVRVQSSKFQPPDGRSLLRPLLTFQSPTPATGDPQARTRCFLAQPPDLPP